MERARFNRIFLVQVLTGLLASAVLALVRFGASDNDLILRHQLSKVDRLASVRALDFAVLGDSSAGNGVSAEVLRALSGAKVENFALTGSFGLAGDLYLMKRLHERHGLFRQHGIGMQEKQLVGVRGAGIAYDGLYYVDSVTHNLKRGEFKQSFQLTRNGLVSITPRVPV